MSEPHEMTQQEIEESERNATFPDDWVTTGWSRRPNTRRWVEMGGSAGITVDPPPLPPEIGIHDVAAELNKWDGQIKQLIEECTKLMGLFADLSRAAIEMKADRKRLSHLIRQADLRLRGLNAYAELQPNVDWRVDDVNCDQRVLRRAIDKDILSFNYPNNDPEERT